MNTLENRRLFLQNLAVGALTMLSFPSIEVKGNAPPQSNRLLDESQQLLAAWCQSLVNYQVQDIRFGTLYGGILCPACGRMHGRCGEAVYPLLSMAKRSKKQSYATAALRLFDWMERNVSLPDGSWSNDINVSSWNGTTVFTAISLAEAIYHHGDQLDTPTKARWLIRLRAAADFIDRKFTIEFSNINYPITAAYALQLFGKIFHDDKLIHHGQLLAKEALRFFTSTDGFIYGEGGGDRYPPGPKGSLPVDLGYNVEESLPYLVMCIVGEQNEHLRTSVVKSLKTHMEFMLPDGGWDNSWGTRNYKWAYWGGRTTKGCQCSYGLMVDDDPRFYTVARKNLEMLRACTHDGLLYGGPHNFKHGVLPCIHHTIGHANSLATLLDCASYDQFEKEPALLPREMVYGIKEFSDVRTWLISTENWVGTIVGYDREYSCKNGHPSGGSIGMLFHRKVGVILTASMTEYQLVEPPNMQAQHEFFSGSLTMRVQTSDGKYLSCSYLSPEIISFQNGSISKIITQGYLVDGDQQHPDTGPIPYKMQYVFQGQSIELEINIDGISTEEIEIILPVISQSNEAVEWSSDKTIEIQRATGRIAISSTQKMLIKPLPMHATRWFNFVPGMEAIPLYVSGTKAKFTISVSEA
ncbi:hypothetical protein [Chryseolinea lacunae]|uniref:Uncharacterized protein n=1 Tax=Chryseolinea lacunae TaxID=2801331 RepID=A0ABS1L5J5_9BACT|nr:hypothetical protein [Chryseolinea lacunae]MBL0745806.1 hypothetical protein [Chryseolinea lacunae]